MDRKTDVILIFDIGKTNKKYVLYDREWKIHRRDSLQTIEVQDDDGDAADDLAFITQWIKIIVESTLALSDYRLVGVNFSTYGASLVHLGFDQQVVAPFYNYVKPFPENLFHQFEKDHNQSRLHEVETGSPGIGMLNSGLQLYMLKFHKPELYKKIWRTVHFPQFLSYSLTGVLTSEYTSIGCHTAMWHHDKQEYHTWFRKENFDRLLPPPTDSNTTVSARISGHSIDVGIGIHDSSAALVPYLTSISEPFMLISTGTWSVTLNPFSRTPLDIMDIKNGGLYYMQVTGKPVMAHRLFLGYEYSEQIKKLAKDRGKTVEYIQSFGFNTAIFSLLQQSKQKYFCFSHLGEPSTAITANVADLNLEVAYHQLMIELVDHQIRSVLLAKKRSQIRKIIVDGGFTRNAFFLKILAHNLADYTIYSSSASLGSALGAGIVMRPRWWTSKSFAKTYKLRHIT